MIDTEKNIELLYTSLNSRKPILFLGAGFSYGALCNGHKIPMGEELRSILHKEFYELNCPNDITTDDKEQIGKYSLSELCKAIQQDGRKSDLERKLLTLLKVPLRTLLTHIKIYSVIIIGIKYILLILMTLLKIFSSRNT